MHCLNNQGSFIALGLLSFFSPLSLSTISLTRKVPHAHRASYNGGGGIGVPRRSLTNVLVARSG